MPQAASARTLDVMARQMSVHAPDADEGAHEFAADDRVRRSQRSGQAIVEALLDLVGDGILEPTDLFRRKEIE